MGIPSAACDDRVEEGVLGIVVVVEVAREPQLIEQVRSQRVERRRFAAPGELVEADDPLVDIETGVGVRGNAQGGNVERHFGGGSVDRLDETLARGCIAAGPYELRRSMIGRAPAAVAVTQLGLLPVGARDGAPAAAPCAHEHTNSS